MQEGPLDIQFCREKKFRKHMVLIDSALRDTSIYPTPTHYRLNLPTTYKQVKRVRMLTAEVPSRFYIFTAAQKNTTLHIGIYDSSNVSKLTLQTITIPDGNYTNDTLTSTLEDLLDMNALFTSEGITFTVSIEPTTFLLNITPSAERKIYIDTTYTGSTSSIGWGLEYYLGFLPNNVTEPTNASDPCVASRVIKLNPINYLLLDIAEINGMDECHRSTKSVFAKIPNNVNSFDMIMMDETSCCSYNQTELNPLIGKLSTLTISWRFTNMAPIDFNDMDHSFTLEIECIE